MYGNKYGEFSFFDQIMAIENHKKGAHDFITFLFSIWHFGYIYRASQKRAVLLIPQIARIFAPRHRLSSPLSLFKFFL
jgi:hypothetical protein